MKKLKIYFNHFISLLKHKYYVFQAGRLLKVPLWRLIIHDFSKFSAIEFFSYAEWNAIPKEQRNKFQELAFSRALLHHFNNNPHHPEYWVLRWYQPIIFNGCEIIKNNAVFPMKEVYVREMLADWMGASKEYAGTWIISKWLNENGPKMLLHSQSMEILVNILIDELGFFLTDNCDWSYMAGDKYRKWANE